MTLTAIVEELLGDGNSKMTAAEHQDWDRGDTTDVCHVCDGQNINGTVCIGRRDRRRRHTIPLLDNLTEESEEADDDQSDDTAITDLTQVPYADELLCKGKLKLLTKDMHEYYTSHATSDYRVAVGTFWAAKSVREDSLCRVYITRVDEDDVDGNIETDDVSSEQSLRTLFAIL
ncbi:hypothetical protein LSAT2_011181 [Lamellibrachia satsuma]|nr:hypothetical protein LSAT2_011181 [Lamellibrachia satsuma]